MDAINYVKNLLFSDSKFWRTKKRPDEVEDPMGINFKKTYAEKGWIDTIKTYGANVLQTAAEITMVGSALCITLAIGGSGPITIPVAGIIGSVAAGLHYLGEDIHKYYAPDDEADHLVHSKSDSIYRIAGATTLGATIGGLIKAYPFLTKLYGTVTGVKVANDIVQTMIKEGKEVEYEEGLNANNLVNKAVYADTDPVSGKTTIREDKSNTTKMLQTANEWYPWLKGGVNDFIFPGFTNATITNMMGSAPTTIPGMMMAKAFGLNKNTWGGMTQNPYGMMNPYGAGMGMGNPFGQDVSPKKIKMIKKYKQLSSKKQLELQKKTEKKLGLNSQSEVNEFKQNSQAAYQKQLYKEMMKEKLYKYKNKDKNKDENKDKNKDENKDENRGANGADIKFNEVEVNTDIMKPQNLKSAKEENEMREQINKLNHDVTKKKNDIKYNQNNPMSASNYYNRQ